MKPTHFKQTYLNVLHTDPDTKEQYVKIPIENLDELAHLQKGLLRNLLLLSQISDEYHSSEHLKTSMYWLCKILLASYPDQELEGIARFLEEE